MRILATSDLHGKFIPWDYALNAESPSGSVALLATAIAAYRTDDTILVDGGDTIQDNSVDIFIDDGDVHPMIKAINALDYDVWVTGNHEYDFSMDVVKKTIQDLKCRALTGNVYDVDGRPIADGYTMLDLNGVRVAVIGMVTPNIARWDAANLADCAVTDPLEETRKIIDGIRVPLKTNATPDEMNFSQIWLAKDAGCLAGSQGFCKSKMAEIQPSGGDESF